MIECKCVAHLSQIWQKMIFMQYISECQFKGGYQQKKYTQSLYHGQRPTTDDGELKSVHHYHVKEMRTLLLNPLL